MEVVCCYFFLLSQFPLYFVINILITVLQIMLIHALCIFFKYFTSRTNAIPSAYNELPQLGCD